MSDYRIARFRTRRIRFTLVYGLSKDEAAEVLGISISTLKRRWQTARIQLVEALGCELLIEI